MLEFLHPYLLWLLALAIPLIALYLLKARRDRRSVSAAWLWQEVQQDLEARVPLRRLRRDWLLLLQLLLLFLLVVAAAGPFRRAFLTSGSDAVVVVDVSASLLAGERSEAQERTLRELIDGLSGGDRLAFLRAGGESEVLLPLTDQRSALLDALPALRPSATPSDLPAAIELASRLAGENGTVLVLTDASGELDLRDTSTAAAHLQVRRLEADGPLDNVGIIALGVRAGDASGRDHQVFVRLLNASSRTARGTLRLLADDHLRDAAALEIPADAEAGHTLRLTGVDEAMLEIQWNPETPDALALDDRAFWVLRAPQPRRYRMEGRADPAVARALGVDRTWLPAEPGSKADVEILVQTTPRPDGPPFLWIAPPDLSGGGPGSVLSWEKTHPSLRFVDLRGVRLSRAARWERPPGARVLATSSAGPLILEGRRESRPYLLWAFDPLETDLPGRVAFPLLVRNALEHLVPEDGPLAGGLSAGEKYSLSSASLLSSTASESSALHLKAPSGLDTALASSSGTDLYLPALEETGVWTLSSEEGEEIDFAVSLLSADESDLRPRDDAFAGTEAAPEQVAEEISARSALLGLWRPLALLALLLLLIEAAAFHRRWAL